MGLVGASWVHVRPSSYGVHQRSGKCPGRSRLRYGQVAREDVTPWVYGSKQVVGEMSHPGLRFETGVREDVHPGFMV